jgi:hypothetical protein
MSVFPLEKGDWNLKSAQSSAHSSAVVLTPIWSKASAMEGLLEELAERDRPGAHDDG